MRSLVLKLHICASCVGRRYGKANLGDNLVWLQCRLERPYEKVIRFDGTHSIGTLYQDIGLKSQYDPWHIGGRIRVGNTTADRATIAYLWITDDSYSFWQQGEMAADDIRILKHDICCHCPDGNDSILLMNVGQAIDPTNINQMARLRQAQLHQGKQTMSTRQ